MRSFFWRKFFIFFENIQTKMSKSANSKTERFVIFPIQHKELWKHYKKQVANFWTPEAVDMSQDYHDFMYKLNDNERHYIKHILAFFAASDGIVSKNLDENFIRDAEEAGILEAVFIYQFQAAIENIHNEAYSLMLDVTIKDPEDKHKLFNAIETVPSIKMKADWALKWIGKENQFVNLPDEVKQHLLANYETFGKKTKDFIDYRQPSFAERLIAWVAIEGIFFSPSFAAIYWLKTVKKACPGICKSNEWIARDEGMHTDTAVFVYHVMGKRLPKERVYEIIDEAVQIEKYFVTEGLPVRLINMNADKMCMYIEFVADRLLLQLGYPKKYNVKNPLDFIEMLSMGRKVNFFEDRVAEYQKMGVVASADSIPTTMGGNDENPSKKTSKLSLNASF